ncbi:MAG: response regulator [Candidatus Altiarchaeales archaeon]|nr:response regulator [Candidatus Altiarchaeales archaeon]MBD3417110.1 response regulator [Candidatus Altiarchaeales archaeon]
MALAQRGHSGPNVKLMPDLDVSSGGGKPKVLLVEDNDKIRKLWGESLEHYGFTPILASDGAEGLERFRGEPGVQAVITDYQTPRMNGLQLAEAIKQSSPDVGVILASGSSELISRFEAVEHDPKRLDPHIDHFFSKPVDFDNEIIPLLGEMTKNTSI